MQISFLTLLFSTWKSNFLLSIFFVSFKTFLTSQKTKENVHPSDILQLSMQWNYQSFHMLAFNMHSLFLFYRLGFSFCSCHISYMHVIPSIANEWHIFFPSLAYRPCDAGVWTWFCVLLWLGALILLWWLCIFILLSFPQTKKKCKKEKEREYYPCNNFQLFALYAIHCHHGDGALSPVLPANKKTSAKAKEKEKIISLIIVSC